MDCPNEKLILDYCKKRKLRKAELKGKGWAGWELYGEGREDGWPKVWKIVEELGMAYGCGWWNGRQCNPEKARLPKKRG